MKKIFIRSPYFIQVNEANQLGSKVELYLYNKNDAVPILPTYVLSKKIATETQLENTYNIANYAKEFIKPIKTYTTTSPEEEAEETWVYCVIKRYTELTLNVYSLLSTETFVCLNGYTDYTNGYNQNNNSENVPMFNTGIKIYRQEGFNGYVNAWIDSPDVGTSYALQLPNQSLAEIVPTGSVYKLPYLVDGRYALVRIRQAAIEQFSFIVETICELKYTPITCTFINRFGGWQFLTFFKANKTSIDTSYKKFNLSPENINYNPYLGVTKTFNQQGTQKITCNTGWVDENYFDLIQDLLLSQTVLLDNKPVIVKSQSSDKKTYLKEKNINYTIDFEYAYGLINDVI